MKKLLALIVALIMVIPAAVAEESTIYTLALTDPCVTYNDETIDMSGLTLDLSAALTDSGLNGLLLKCYAGNEQDLVTALTAQVDANGLGLLLEGMSNVYSVDLDAYMGMSIYHTLGVFPLRTMLDEFDVSDLVETEGETLTMEDRLAFPQEWLADYIYDTTVDGNETTHSFSISEEQGAELWRELLKSFRDEIDYDTYDELRDADFAFTLDGQIVVTEGESCSMIAGGELISRGENEALDLSLNYFDDLSNLNCVFDLADDKGQQVMCLTADVQNEQLTDGREKAVANVTISADGEDMTIRVGMEPQEGSTQTDYSIGVTVPAEETSLTFWLSTGTNPQGEGFAAGVAGTVEGEEGSFSIAYDGTVESDSVLGERRIGSFRMEYDDGYDAVSFATGVQLYRQDVDSDAWTIDTEGALDIDSLTDAEMNTATMGLIGALGNALPKLQSGVPGLSEYIDALMSEMMGGSASSAPNSMLNAA